MRDNYHAATRRSRPSSSPTATERRPGRVPEIFGLATSRAACQTRPMHRTAEHVASELASRGVEGQVRELTEPAPTAATAAAQLGCEVGAIANSLLFSADGEPLLVLTSGAHRVDTAKVAAELGVEKVRRADPDFVYASTGQRIGGVAPIGQPEPVRTLVDLALRSYNVIWAAAGHV